MAEKTMCCEKNYQRHIYKDPSFKELLRLSNHIASCWMHFGVELGLKPEKVDAINAENLNVKSKCYMMFNSWLKSLPDPCWCEIAKALEMVDLVQVYKQVSNSYLSYATEQTDRPPLDGLSQAENEPGSITPDTVSKSNAAAEKQKTEPNDTIATDPDDVPSKQSTSSKPEEIPPPAPIDAMEQTDKLSLDDSSGIKLVENKSSSITVGEQQLPTGTVSGVTGKEKSEPNDTPTAEPCHIPSQEELQLNPSKPEEAPQSVPIRQRDAKGIFLEYIGVIMNQCIEQNDPRPGFAYLDKVVTEFKNDKK